MVVPFDEWKITYEDDQFEIRLDPLEPEGYGLKVKETEEYLLFARGTTKEITRSDRDRGRQILENTFSAPPRFDEKGNLYGTQANKDDIVAALAFNALREEERYQRYLMEERERLSEIL